MNRLLIISLVTIMLATACNKDKGNYTYHDVNTSIISGVENTYVVDYGKNLVIRPKLNFTDGNPEDAVNYTYQWVQNRQLPYTGTALVLSNSRDLNLNIRMAYGNYEMYYRITDKRTGVFTDALFTLTVSSPTYEGWMALCDTEDGAGRLDMIARRGAVDVLYKNVLDTVKSAFKINSKPEFIGIGNTALQPGNGTMAPFIGMSNNATVLGKDTLEYDPSYDLNNQIVGDIKVNNYTGARFYPGKSYTGVLYADNKLYREELQDFAGPVNKQDASTTYFKPSPYVGLGASSAVVFNMDNNTFLRLPHSSGSAFACLSMPKGTLFDYTLPVNMELKWLGYTALNTEMYALMRNKTTNKVYLGRFIQTGVTQSYYGEVVADGIADAENFCISPEYGYIFYTIGNKVYEYDVSLQKAFLMKDYGTKKVSLMKFHTFINITTSYLNAPFYVDLSKKLVICTYDSGKAATSGIMDLYTVPAINGTIKPYKSYEGLGKVVSLSYRER